MLFFCILLIYTPYQKRQLKLSSDDYMEKCIKGPLPPSLMASFQGLFAHISKLF